MGSKKRILEAIKQNPNATYAEIAKVCGMSVTNVYHHVAKLVEDGVVSVGDKWVIL